MFVYNLYTHKTEGESAMPGNPVSRAAPADAIQQSGDAVLWVFPYLDADTFNFENQQGKDITVVKNKRKDGTTSRTTIAKKARMGDAVKLDPYLTNLKVTQSKDSHLGTLNALLLDPDDTMLARISPGDLVFCWMFDNHKDAQTCRRALEAGEYGELNVFASGLKFVGKLFAARKTVNVSPNGLKMRRISVMATSFSELDSNIYFDPQLTTNFLHGLQFMLSISEQLNESLGVPEDVNKALAGLLTVFMGVGLKGSQSAGQMSRPLKVPEQVGKILSVYPSAHYIDILQTQIGVQKYVNDYMPDGLGKNAKIAATGARTKSPYPTIRYTPNGLIGWVSPFVQPFNNVPIWGILKQYCNKDANEMFTTLRVDQRGRIMPTLVMRQLPFNTDDFVKNFKDIKATAFRTLPRWKVEDPMIVGYNVGKSESLRTNFVRVHATSWIDKQRTDSINRSLVPPISDISDIERNGLRAYLSDINSVYGVDKIVESTYAWTVLITDRLMGGHLKYSGSIDLAGCQEPIAVGDNLEYDNLVFHIEQVDHSLTVDGVTGRKSFSTSLALSSGVPATGPVFPSIVNRLSQGGTAQQDLSNAVATNFQKDST